MCKRDVVSDTLRQSLARFRKLVITNDDRAVPSIELTRILLNCIAAIFLNVYQQAFNCFGSRVVNRLLRRCGFLQVFNRHALLSGCLQMDQPRPFQGTTRRSTKRTRWSKAYAMAAITTMPMITIGVCRNRDADKTM